jgi:hypothetical protein
MFVEGKGGVQYGLLADLTVDPVVTRGVTTQVDCNLSTSPAERSKTKSVWIGIDGCGLVVSLNDTLRAGNSRYFGSSRLIVSKWPAMCRAAGEFMKKPE